MKGDQMFRCFALGRQELFFIISMIIFFNHCNISISRSLEKKAKNTRQVSEIIRLEQNIPVHTVFRQTYNLSVLY